MARYRRLKFNRDPRDAKSKPPRANAEWSAKLQGCPTCGSGYSRYPLRIRLRNRNGKWYDGSGTKVNPKAGDWKHTEFEPPCDPGWGEIMICANLFHTHNQPKSAESQAEPDGWPELTEERAIEISERAAENRRVNRQRQGKSRR